MVRVPGGAFVMGAGTAEWRGKQDLQQQAVEVREFFLDATAVTNSRFREFRKATSYQTDAETFGWSFVLELHATEQALASTNQTVKEAPHWLAVPAAWWRQPLGPGSGIKSRLEHPVVHISWNDANKFCKWAGAAATPLSSLPLPLASPPQPSATATLLQPRVRRRRPGKRLPT